MGKTTNELMNNLLRREHGLLGGNDDEDAAAGQGSGKPKVPPGGAGEGTGTAAPSTKTNMNDFIRVSAGKHKGGRR